MVERTPTGVRNRGASERKTTRRVEVFVTEGSTRTADRTPGEGQRRERGDEMQGAREKVPPQENMDDLLEAVAEAISEEEREAPETHDNS